MDPLAVKDQPSQYQISNQTADEKMVVLPVVTEMIPEEEVISEVLVPVAFSSLPIVMNHHVQDVLPDDDITSIDHDHNFFVSENQNANTNLVDLSFSQTINCESNNFTPYLRQFQYVIKLEKDNERLSKENKELQKKIDDLIQNTNPNSKVPKDHENEEITNHVKENITDDENMIEPPADEIMIIGL